MSSVSIEHADRPVTADIEFLGPTGSRPFCYGYEPGPGAPPPSIDFEPHRVAVRDVRALARPLTLERNGAALLRHASAVRDFYDTRQLEQRYYAESAELIRSALGAREAIVFDHNVRRGRALPLRTDRYDQGRPVLHAHTDYTEASAARRLQDLLGAPARELATRRYVQINLWRPIRAPLRDAPLAICDGATVTPDRLRAVDLLYPGRTGEIYYLSHDARQRWYYAPDMGTDEVWLFKNFDSARTGVARAAPHSAFADPAPRGPVTPRESIEVRAFAFFDA